MVGGGPAGEAAWAAWHAELDRWRDMGRTATLWWRDDDAVEPTPALERLLAVQEAAAVPLCLAVVPRGTGPELAARIARPSTGQTSHICVAAHGLAHVNHAPPPEKKAEFGPHRPAEVMAGEIAAGWDIIRALFGDHAVPIFVPPWNQMAAELTGHLAGAGFAGVSALASGQLAPGVTQVTVRDVHVDIIDWRVTRRFAGEAGALGALVEHLRARRAGGSAANEPTGLLTHHLVHDDEAWEFLSRLFGAAHESARWLSAREVFSLK